MINLLAMMAMSFVQERTINDFNWLTGSWSAEVEGGVFHETWLEPAGGTMQGCGRFLQDDKCAFMEFMSIEMTPRGWAMFMVLGQPSKKVNPPVPFYLKKLLGKSCQWERDDKNDFPKRITYTADSDGTLRCRIEDDKRHEDFVFKKR